MSSVKVLSEEVYGVRLRGFHSRTFKFIKVLFIVLHKSGSYYFSNNYFVLGKEKKGKAINFIIGFTMTQFLLIPWKPYLAPFQLLLIYFKESWTNIIGRNGGIFFHYIFIIWKITMFSWKKYYECTGKQ